MNKISDYLTIKKAAQFIGVHPTTLKNWEKSGKLVSYRHPQNNYRLYRKTDLEALLLSICKCGRAIKKNWIRVKDEIPPEGTLVLVLVLVRKESLFVPSFPPFPPDGYNPVVSYREGKDWVGEGLPSLRYGESWDIRYWMELPTFPDIPDEDEIIKDESCTK